MKTNYNKSEIMRNAWAIRRETNCTMSVALINAWAIAKAPAKTIETLTVEDLTALGGKLWEKNGMRRVYFNKAEIMDICNIEVDYYKTSNIKGFAVNGEWISNSRGRAWMETINGGIWFDLNSRKFCQKWRTNSFDSVVDVLTEAILAA